MDLFCFKVEMCRHMLADAADEKQPAACVAQQAVVYIRGHCRWSACRPTQPKHCILDSAVLIFASVCVGISCVVIAWSVEHALPC